jgi:hypothetical protein
MPLPAPKYHDSLGRLLAIFQELPDGQQVIELIPWVFGILSKTQDEKQTACLSDRMEHTCSQRSGTRRRFVGPRDVLGHAVRER